MEVGIFATGCMEVGMLGSCPEGTQVVGAWVAGMGEMRVACMLATGPAESEDAISCARCAPAAGGTEEHARTDEQDADSIDLRLRALSAGD